MVKLPFRGWYYSYRTRHRSTEKLTEMVFGNFRYVMWRRYDIKPGKGAGLIYDVQTRLPELDPRQLLPRGVSL